jgi:hypothetical protein
MSRTKSRRDGERPPARSRPRPPWHHPGRLVTAALIALSIIVAALLLRAHGNTANHALRAVTIDDQALLDSLVAANARRDWESALFWAERLGPRRPRDHYVLLARGTAWNNYAVEQRPGRALARPALRTSLQRMDCLRRALSLSDSSAKVARGRDKWVESMMRLGHINETLGLSGDALIAYETVKQRLPDELGSAYRAYWLRALFYDPVHPDTSEWDRRMRSLGRR